MEKNNGGSAFPNGETVGQCSVITGGMTLRDYFAGQAMAGMLASETNGTAYNRQTIANLCYGVADAMIAEREK